MNRSNMISVVLPCYNAEKYVQEAITSILNQTYANLELIIINDGSTDKSLAVIEQLAKIDRRIVIISRENRGLIASLNEGIKLAKGTYIARMDADDISLPNRFQQQLDFMQQQKLDLVGGAISRFYPDTAKKDRPKYYPETNNELVASLLTMKSRIAHPTVLAKRAVFDDYHYDPRFKHAEDYALWLQITLGGKYKMGNVPEIVLRYRAHAQQVHILNKIAQQNAKRDAFSALMSESSVCDIFLARRACDYWRSSSFMEKVRLLSSLKVWFNAVTHQNFFDKGMRRPIIKRIFKQLI